MVSVSQLQNMIRRLKKQIMPNPDETILMHFPTLGSTYELTVAEFDEAEQSSFNGQPNELAKKFQRYLNDGHFDESGLVCFFVDISNLWNEDDIE